MIVVEKERNSEYEEALSRISNVSKKNAVYVTLYTSKKPLSNKDMSEILDMSDVHVRKEINNISKDHLYDEKEEGVKTKLYSLTPVGSGHVEKLVERYLLKMQVRDESFVFGQNDLQYKNVSSSSMTAQQLFEIFEEVKSYLETNLSDEIILASTSEYKIVSIDYSDLAKYSPEIADLFISNYVSAEQCFRQAIQGLEGYDASIVLSNLPPSMRADIRRIDSKHKNKLFYCEGVVRVVQNRKDRANLIRYECPSCGNLMSIFQDEETVKTPVGCPECSRKGRFKVLEHVFEPYIAFRVEEKFEQVLSNNSPQQKVVYARGEAITRPEIEQRLAPGSRIRVIGYADIHQKSRGNTKLNQYESFIVANNIQLLEDAFDTVELSKEDEESMKQFALDAKKDLEEEFEKYIKSFVPHVVGHREVAKAVTLSLHSAADQIKGNNKKDRNRIHVMLLGDPGTCKTDFLRAAMNLAPRSRFATGDALTKVGITASVIKDELTGDFEVHAGLLALCDKTHAFIDELDKARQEDLAGLYSALETGEIDINKANMHTKISASATVIFAANPKFGRFDVSESSKPLSEQFDFPAPILDRCDLIVPVLDTVDEINDANIARSVVSRKSTGDYSHEIVYSDDWLRKKILYVKQHSNIELPFTEEVENKLGEYYVKQRLKSSRGRVTITPRTLEAFARLARSVAMFRHAWLTDGIVTVADLDVAVRVWEDTTGKLIMDSEGNYNVDKLSGNMWVRSHRDRFVDWFTSQPDDLVNVSDMVERLVSYHDMDESSANKFIDSMEQASVIFKPSPGRYKLL